MIERNGRRWPLLGVVLGTVLLFGCRDPKKDEASPSVSSAPVATTPMAAPSASVAVADPPPTENVREEIDAGSDGGPRKLRRLVAAGAPDAGPGLVEAAPPSGPAPAPATEAASDLRRAKRPSTPMGDDLPFGGATGSASPVLKKAPMGADDPWAKPAPAPSR